jgi:type II secretory pathway component GspD/PulD (secretin)
MRGRASLHATTRAPHRKGEGRGVKSALALLALILGLASPLGAATFEIYVPRNRPAEELVPLVQGVLAGQGSAVADPHSGKIVLSGDPAAMEEALALLRSLDAPIHQYRVESETTTRAALDQASASVSGWIDAGGVRIGRVRGPEGVNVRASAGGGDSVARLGASVVVLEGHSAEIWTGSDYPVTSRTVERAGRYSRTTESTELVQVRSGFRVRPRAAGDDAIELDITPIVSELGPGGSIREQGAATQIRVRAGESIVIGGVTREAGGSEVDVFRGAARSSGSSDSVLVVRVTEIGDAGDAPASRGR